MKRKWNLMQVSEVDPEGPVGRDPAHDTNRLKKSVGTNIKARALAELDNPSVIVALGGGNQYVHSTEAYFRRGLSTAIKRMNLHLEALVQEQQQKMRDLIVKIDAEWNIKLSQAFGPDTFKSFAEFKKFWDAQIVHNPNPNDFMRKMQHLVELKKIKTILGALDVSNCSSFTLPFNIENGALADIEFVPLTIKASIDFSQCPNLSDVSIQSIIDGLADLTGSTTQKVSFHNSVKAKLTDSQKATATQKNWTIA